MPRNRQQNRSRRKQNHNKARTARSRMSCTTNFTPEKNLSIQISKSSVTNCSTSWQSEHEIATNIRNGTICTTPTRTSKQKRKCRSMKKRSLISLINETVDSCLFTDHNGNISSILETPKSSLIPNGSIQRTTPRRPKGSDIKLKNCSFSTPTQSLNSKNCLIIKPPQSPYPKLQCNGDCDPTYEQEIIQCKINEDPKSSLLFNKTDMFYKTPGKRTRTNSDSLSSPMCITSVVKRRKGVKCRPFSPKSFGLKSIHSSTPKPEITSKSKATNTEQVILPCPNVSPIPVQQKTEHATKITIELDAKPPKWHSSLASLLQSLGLKFKQSLLQLYQIVLRRHFVPQRSEPECGCNLKIVELQETVERLMQTVNKLQLDVNNLQIQLVKKNEAILPQGNSPEKPSAQAPSSLQPPPPPPPPPPLPPPLTQNNIYNAGAKPRLYKTCIRKLDPLNRPSITLDDILRVKLRKTSTTLPVKTVQSATQSNRIPEHVLRRVKLRSSSKSRVRPPILDSCSGDSLLEILDQCSRNVSGLPRL